MFALLRLRSALPELVISGILSNKDFGVLRFESSIGKLYQIRKNDAWFSENTNIKHAAWLLILAPVSFGYLSLLPFLRDNDVGNDKRDLFTASRLMGV